MKYAQIFNINLDVILTSNLKGKSLPPLLACNEIQAPRPLPHRFVNILHHGSWHPSSSSSSSSSFSVPRSTNAVIIVNAMEGGREGESQREHELQLTDFQLSTGPQAQINFSPRRARSASLLHSQQFFYWKRRNRKMFRDMQIIIVKNDYMTRNIARKYNIWHLQGASFPCKINRYCLVHKFLNHHHHHHSSLVNKGIKLHTALKSSALQNAVTVVPVTSRICTMNQP